MKNAVAMSIREVRKMDVIETANGRSIVADVEKMVSPTGGVLFVLTLSDGLGSAGRVVTAQAGRTFMVVR